jgi:hypothetical protein
MSKLYYTDPLKAAWMAREFGVEYTHSNLKGHDKYTYNYIPFFDYEYDSYPECPKNEAITDPCMLFEIDPDSLHIFEPKVGDVIKVNDPPNYFGELQVTITIKSIRDIDANGCYGPFVDFIYGDEEYNWFCPGEVDFETIYRDNKVFFMPEVEDD